MIKLKTKTRILVLIISISLCSLISLPISSLAFNNGDPDDVYYGVRFGSHDWIALKANSFLPEPNQTWITTYIEAYLRGTAAPDNSSETYGGLTGYGDTTLHHNFYNPDGSANDSAAATRAQEEYNKALNAMQSGKWAEGAWYAGCMTHYIADLAVWGHVMENETVHSAYESSTNTRMDNPSESYFQITFDGSYDTITGYQASFDVGWETYRGDVSWQYNCNWMDANYHAWDGTHPDDTFELRGQYLIELAINKITDLLYTLSPYYLSSYSPPPIPGFEFFMIGIALISLVMIYSVKKAKISKIDI